ncbi:MAG: type II secretion system F family protein [Planctomycetota bacterium]|jgi:type II secretory pathway component PulF
MLTIAILILVFYVILAFIKPGIAFITSPVVCLLLAFAGVAKQEYEVVFSAVVIFITTLAIVSLRKPEPDAERWPHIWAKWILISIPFLLLLNAGIFVFDATNDRLIIFIFLILFIIMAIIKPGIAVITSPVVCLVLAWAGYVTEAYEAIFSAVFIFIATMSIVSVTKPETDTEQWPQILAKWILISIPILLLLAATVVFTAAGAGGPIFFMFFIMAVALIGAIISCALSSRHTTAVYVVSTIGSSMRQNLPLPMALESAAAGRKDRRSMTLQRIQKWLVQGYSLSQSIRRGYPKCPGYAVAMIAAAERIDQLPLAMGALEADMLTKADERRKIKPVHPLYPVIVISFTFFILLSFMKFVVPQFKTVLEEMVGGAALPAPTRLLLGITNFIAYEYGWVIVLLLALIVLVAIPVSIRVKFRPRRPEKPYLLSRIGDFTKWHLPVLRWFEKNYSMVQVVELLRLSLNAGSTVNDAIADTLGLDVNNCFRKRIREWLAKVQRGDNIATAAREAKLGSPLAWAFDDHVNQGNTLAILEMLESFYRSNYSYHVNLARFIIWPCIILAMGVAVGFVVYAIFSPMIAIIGNMVELAYP